MSKPTFFTYAKNARREIRHIAAETGLSVFELWGAFAEARIFSRAAIWEFKLMRLYEYPFHIRRQFLSVPRCIKVSNLLIGGATQEELDCYGKKNVFNELFGEYIHRDWLYVPDCTPEDIRAFLQRNDTFLAKEIGSTQGHNIHLYRTADLDADAFPAEYAGKTYVFEAFIRQHPVLAAINPTSVNTIRLVTAGYKGQTAIIGGCLRTGGAGAFVDNFHSGGVAFPLDLTCGIVTGPGRSFDGQTYIRHPATGTIVPGTEIPYWDELTRQVLEAAKRVPSVGYIGWDIAVTPEGVEFIEGNVDIPDHTLIQMDKPDAYRRVTDFLKTCGAGT